MFKKKKRPKEVPPMAGKEEKETKGTKLKSPGEKEFAAAEIIEGMIDGVVITDMELRALQANKAVLKRFGYKIEEVIGKPVYSFIAKEEMQKAIETLQEAIIKGVIRNVEFTGVTKGGERFPISVSGTLIRDEKGEPKHTIIVLRDITERKRTEEERAKASADREKAELIDAMPDALNVLDLDGRIVTVNPAYTKMFGWKPEEIIGKSVDHMSETFVKPEDIEFILKTMGEVIKTGTVRKPVETVVLTKDGREVPISVTYSLIKDAEGNLKNIITLIRDITERKQAEKILRKSEQKFKDLSEITTDWIWETDEQGVYTYVSPKIKDLLGYEVSEMLGKTPFDLMPKEEAERISKFFNEKLINKESFYGLENVNRHKDGHLVILETNGIPIFDERGQLKGYRGIDRNITERKRAERIAQETQNKLIQSEKLAAIGQFASSISHDLRTPLATISNVAYYISHKISKDDKELGEQIELMKGELKRAERAVNDIMDFTRPLKLEIAQVNLNKLIKDLLLTVKDKISLHRIKLTRNLTPNLPQIQADSDRLKQVFINLISNSLQAMPEEGKLTINSRKKKGFIEVDIIDTGTGISKENIDKLFDPFFTTTKGSGLGLTIVKSIIGNHDGTINLVSEVNKGTTVTVRLPISRKKEG